MKILFALLLFPILMQGQLNSAFVSKANLSYQKVQTSNEGMFAFEQNNKIGYLDKNGNVVIPAIYSYDSTTPSYPVIPFFYKGYAKAIKDRKFGLIDKTGKIVIPIDYENISPYTEFGNFVLVTKTIAGKKNYGLMNLQGKELIPVENEEIKVDTNIALVKKNGKWGLFDKTGNQLLPFDYNWLAYSATDKVLLAEKGTQYGVIDMTGKWLFEKTKSVYTLYTSKYGMVMCKVSGKTGFLDLKGNEVIITRYDGAYDFNSEGLAMVYKKKEGTTYTNLYGYIDKKGNEVIPLKYELLGTFFNGLVEAKNPETNRYGYMDKTGKWVLQPVYLDAKSFDGSGGAWVKMTDDKYHYINKTGKDLGTLTEKGGIYQTFGKDGFAVYETTDYPYVLIDKTGKVIKQIDDCDGIYNFSEGIAGYKSKATGKYGFLDLNGNKIIPAEFDGFTGFVEGVSKVNKTIDGKTKYGYIDNKGKIILPVLYDYAQSFKDGWGLIKKDNNYFFVDKNGNLKEPPGKYDELSEFRSGYALGKFKGSDVTPNTYHYINPKLEIEFSVLAWQAYLFWENVAVVSRDNKIYELMNKKGEVFKTLTGIETLTFCSEGILAIREKGKWGYINDKGDVIVTPKYDTCTSFKYGYARIKMGSKWGIIDRSGTEVIGTEYDGIYPGENGIFIFYDKSWGIIDKSGKKAPDYFNSLTTFEKDRALARLGKTYTILKSPLAKN